MLTNLSFPTQNRFVSSKLNRPVIFLLILLDERFKFYWNRNTSCFLIQKNWKIYQLKKNIKTYSFAILPDTYLPSGHYNISRLSDIRLGF